MKNSKLADKVDVYLGAIGRLRQWARVWKTVAKMHRRERDEARAEAARLGLELARRDARQCETCKHRRFDTQSHTRYFWCELESDTCAPNHFSDWEPWKPRDASAR